MSQLKGRASCSIHDRERWWAILPGYLDRDTDLAQPKNVEIEFDQCVIGEDQDSDDIDIVDGVAVVQVHGVLRKQQTLFERLFGGGTDYMTIANQLQNAASNPSVRAIAMHIDSPGGTVAGGSDAVDAIRSARESKPVIAYISDLGASAAYRLASQSDAIIANRDAQVGSIGTFAVLEDMSKMTDDMGVKVHVVKAGEFKGAGTPGTEITDEQLAEFQREVNALNDIFIEEIMSGRGMSVEQVRGLADGRIHVGRDAVDNGLIDQIGSFQDAISVAQQRSDDSMRNQIRQQLIKHKLRTARRRVVASHT